MNENSGIDWGFWCVMLLIAFFGVVFVGCPSKTLESIERKIEQKAEQAIEKADKTVSEKIEKI